MKYPTSDLIFQFTHELLGECVYKEKSSHECDISQYATRKHCISNLSHVSYIRTQLKIIRTAYQNDSTSSEYIAKIVFEVLNVTVSGLNSSVFFSD